MGTQEGGGHGKQERAEELGQEAPKETEGQSNTGPWNRSGTSEKTSNTRGNLQA